MAVLAVLLLLALWPAAAPADPQTPDEQAAAPVDRAGAYYHLMRATIAAQQGAVRDLSRELREAGRLDPHSAELRAEGAELLLSLGQFAEGQKLARKALRLDPEHRKAARILAEMAARKAVRDDDPESLAEAIRLYEILAADPEVDGETLSTLAQLKFRAGDVEGAIQLGHRLAGVRKGDVRVAHMLSRLYQAASRRSEGLDVLLEFLKTHGEAEKLAGEIRELSVATGRWDEVAEACSERLEVEPDSTPLLRLRGEALSETGRLEAALADLEAAARAGVENPFVLTRLADVYARLGRLADAVACARALEERLPDDPNVQAMLGDYLARQREWGPALDALEAALAGLAGDEVPSWRRDLVRRRLVLLYLEREEFDRAAEVAAAFEQPERLESLELAARVALARGEQERAKTLAGQLRRGGEEGAAALLEGELLVTGDRPSRAAEKFELAIAELGPGASLRIAELWRTHGHPERGERVLRAWVGRQPDDANAHFGLGSFFERLGRFEVAETWLRRAIDLEPRHANALNYLGYLLADRGVHLEEALGLIRRALEVEPWNGAYLDSLGWVLYRLERYEEAREPLEQAARELPGDPTVLEHLGDLYRELGEHELAVRFWHRALVAGAEDPDGVRRKIATEEARLGAVDTDKPR